LSWQVADDKIALMLHQSIAIHGLNDGRSLLSLSKSDKTTFNKVIYVENKYVIINDKVGSLLKRKRFLNLNNKVQHKMVVIDFKELKHYEKDIEREVFSAIFLDNSYLLIADGHECTKWNTKIWPFKPEIIENKPAELDNATLLLTVLPNIFLSASKRIESFWNKNINLVNKIITDHNVVDLKRCDDGFILIVTQRQVLICHEHAIGEIVNVIEMNDSIQEVFQTPDKVFLALVTNIFFMRIPIISFFSIFFYI
jgi:hypothetical protein